MKFNKFLSLCFICTLSMGAMTSCSDDDDDSNSDKVENGKTVVEQARIDGKKFGEDYKVVTGSSETLDKTSAAISMISAASKYKNSTDKTYKTAFAEAAVEIVTGTEAKGDAAVEKMNGILDGLSNLETLKNNLTSGDASLQSSAIMEIINMFSKK
ncbi:MAG: hypothetical protein MJZ19_00265 [Paludibacteraceae bacterium]|nr:hypothetical protein [Paludibacteraceae bacterium]